MELNTVHAQRMKMLSSYKGKIEGMGLKMLFMNYGCKKVNFYILTEDETEIGVPINEGFEIANVIRYLKRIRPNADIEFNDYMQFNCHLHQMFEDIKKGH